MKIEDSAHVSTDEGEHGGEAIALDEPFTGLDADRRRRCVEAVVRLGTGRTILLASHDPRDGPDLGAETLDLSELT